MQALTTGMRVLDGGLWCDLLTHHPTRPPTNQPNKQVVVNFRHITEMENHGVNRTDLNKLMEAGYCTVESVRGGRTDGLTGL